MRFHPPLPQNGSPPNSNADRSIGRRVAIWKIFFPISVGSESDSCRKPAIQLRAQYELNVLRTTVFRDAHTKAEVERAVIKYAYDREPTQSELSTSDW